jgi:hypothetical protein
LNYVINIDLIGYRTPLPGYQQLRKVALLCHTQNNFNASCMPIPLEDEHEAVFSTQLQNQAFEFCVIVKSEKIWMALSFISS